ncbi:alkaline phosphatase [Bacillus marinisedimentorum]|uniref:alkaline phosphatase n=1 Tax=Bacillus marinisedimentorum TaxID=1821260 RepID=UPI0007DF955D|nr:alkaline phosphatase [Bacillus marinisedimentorum]
MKIRSKVMTAVLSAALVAGSFAGVTGLNKDSADALGKNENAYHKKPKNVIVMVGDGMGLGQIEVARMMEYGKEGTLNMEKLENVALMRTYSANNFVTDSAAAGTAIATGTKTNNESIGVDADGNEVDSILDLFKANGKKVGVISTNTVTDATPAAFTASVANRWSGQEEIARQMLANEYDVLLGGGANYFSPRKQEGVDLVQEYEQKGYTIATDRDELMQAGTPDKLLGLFNSSYMNYKLDKDEMNSNEPTLNEMTDKALDVLSQDKDGFFLMVEGARIDHAAHAADMAGVWKETIEFDNTVKDVVNWAKQRKDTLVVVLADHETMGISAVEPMNIEALKEIEVSPEYMAAQLVEDDATGAFTEESVKEIFAEYANISLTNEQVAKFNENVKDSDGKVYAAYRVGWEIGSVIADHYEAGVVDREVREQSSTGGHTGNMVPVFATGAGSLIFEGVLDNTEIAQLIADAARLKAGKEEKAGKKVSAGFELENLKEVFGMTDNAAAELSN